MKKYELHRFDENLLSGDLSGRIDIPLGIPLEIHPLQPYVSKKLIPSGLDIILLEDFRKFFSEVEGIPEFLASGGKGLYMNKDSYIAKRSYEKNSEILRRAYGIETERAIILPNKQEISYWTLIHEGLHDVFQFLQQSKTRKMIKSASAAYDTNKKFGNLLALTHLDISSFDWDVKKLHKIFQRNMEEGIIATEGETLSFFTLKNLERIDQLLTIDEFIANFYTKNRGHDREDEKHLDPKFKETLRKIGYKFENIPEVPRA